MTKTEAMLPEEEKSLGSSVKKYAEKTAVIAAILRRDAKEKYGVELDVNSSYIVAATIQNTTTMGHSADDLIRKMS